MEYESGGRVMDAVKYLKDKARMTKADNSVHDDLCGISCDECPLYDENNGMKVNCQNLESFYPEKSVEIVEKWAKENPKKTRQSEFLKSIKNIGVAWLKRYTVLNRLVVNVVKATG